ncbi:MAG TPA: hypothetical protein VM695_02060 [Phycisphaerae bacterium]|nr:hypothetical protein [Phycisphaerae bacterium]
MTAGDPITTPPPVLAPTAYEPGGPLTAEHMDQLAQAQQRAKKLRKAGGVAMFNGCTIAVFAGLTLLFGLVSPLFGGLDVTALVMGLGLGAIALNEFRGRQLLRRFDRRAPRVLGLNQVGLMVLVIGYCAWMLWQVFAGPNPYAQDIARQPGLGDMLGPIGEVYKQLSLLVYGGVIAGTLIFQGLNAIYYFTRASHLRAYLDQTPPWVVEVQRRTTGS